VHPHLVNYTVGWSAWSNELPLCHPSGLLEPFNPVVLNTLRTGVQYIRTSTLA